MKPLSLLGFGFLFLLIVRWGATRPARTILPIYAGTLPIASAVRLSVPLPAPFNSLSSVIGASVILSCLAHLVIDGSGRIPGVSVALWLIFLAWTSLTMFWALDPSAAVKVVEVAVPLVLVMTVVSVIRVDVVDLDAMRLAIILGGIAVGAYALLLVLTGSRLPSHGVTQRFSIATNPTETDPNILAASLLLPLALSLERLLLGGSRWWSSRAWSLLGGAGTLLILLAILLTGSRGGLLASIAEIPVTVLACRRLSAARVFQRLTVAAVAAVTVAIVLSFAGTLAPGRGPLDRLLSSGPLQRLSLSQGTSGRSDIWITGLRACRLHCAYGAGVGNFPEAYNESIVFSGTSKNVGLDRPAHNVYLDLAVETGFIGLVLFGLALLSEWRSLSSSGVSVLVPSLKPALVAVLIANFFLSTLWFKYFWLVLILIRVAEGAAQPGRDRPRWSRSSVDHDRFQPVVT